MRAHVLLIVVAACSKSADSPSCHDRVQVVAAHLAAPRSPDDIRKTASPWLVAQLDAAASGDPSTRATTFAKSLEDATRNCPEAIKVFGEIGAGNGDKATILRTEIPPALEACACKASPEDVGGLVESVLTVWNG